MIWLADGKQMKAIDSYSMGTLGIPSLVLMERAAYAAALRVDEFLKGDFSKRIVVVCGSGNNGGDGLALTRILYTMGYEKITWYMAGDPKKQTEQTKTQTDILHRMKIEEGSFPECIHQADLIVDALFGVGLSRPITGSFAQIICQINESGRPVCALDMPSGISTDTGAVMGCAIKADFTVTFGLQKLGLVLYPGAEYAGKVFVENIGFPKEAVEQAGIQAQAYEKKDILEKLPKRTAYSNKGSYGRVLVIAGSENMAGACYFSASAAYALGCGLVRVFTVKENHDILLEKIPEAIMTVYDPNQVDMEVLGECLAWADSVILGPGLTTQRYARSIVQYTLKNCKVPLLIDADGLNILSMDSALLELVPKGTVLTPHIGEMARLLNCSASTITGNLISTAVDYASARGVICVLKDARSVITDGGKVYINLFGNDGMAKGGSGDVLSGVIGSLLARKMSPLDAAALGCAIHGCAGDEARKEKGSYGLLASDIIQCFSKVVF